MSTIFSDMLIASAEITNSENILFAFLNIGKMLNICEISLANFINFGL